MVRSFIFLFVLLIPFNLSFAYLYDNGYDDSRRLRIEIDKSEQTLYVMLGDMIVDKYRVSLGSGGRGDKFMRGDNVTPLGEYRITRFNPKSKYNYFMGINYPNEEDADRGFMKGIISAKEYLQIKKSIRANRTPPQNTRLGGYIGIHGPKPGLNSTLRALQSTMNWTEGCIALPYSSLMHLKRYCTIGTKVIIRD